MTPRSGASRPRVMRRVAVIAASVVGVLVAVTGIGYVAQFGSVGDEGDAPHAPLGADASFTRLISHPSFAGFSEMMNPFEPGPVSALLRPLALDRTFGYMGWNADAILDGVNFVMTEVDAGRAQYRALYDDDRRLSDPSTVDAGLLVLPGDRGAPVAIVLAGGGWRAQANVQEAFPLAQQLHDKGYNVAVVRYRIGVHDDDPKEADDPSNGRKAAAFRAREDLATAVAYLSAHGDEWGFSLDGYSVWGSSAGGTTVMGFAGDGAFSAEASGLPRPAAVITAYPADYFWQGADDYPPLYVVAAADDPLVPIDGTDRIVADLSSRGAQVEYERVETGGHGFGLGIGTAAVGWAARAEQFWRAVRFAS